MGNKPKLRVGLLFGGRSAEHEISLLSARNVYQALDRDKYDVVLIGIDKEGRWCLRDRAVLLMTSQKSALPALEKSVADQVMLVPCEPERNLVSVDGGGSEAAVDVVFPVLHGPCGEDGTVQGLLQLAGVPYVGPGVLGSAVGMDKDAAKRLLRDAGIPTARWVTVRALDRGRLEFAAVKKDLGLPLFVKPANLGSSVGISKVRDQAEFEAALNEAFRFDTKILIEESVVGRELECAVLGNEEPQASGVGEIVPDERHGFYSYQAKYIDEHGAAAIIPADIPAETTERVRALAVCTFQALCCEGMSRVDFFLRPNGDLLVNEINTIPGFTSISMYPKLWEQAGLPPAALIDQLIELALGRFRRDGALKTSY